MKYSFSFHDRSSASASLRNPSRVRRGASGVALAALALVTLSAAFGCDSEDDAGPASNSTGAAPSTGGAASGGSATGGSATGGASTGGGSSSGGSPSGTGGTCATNVDCELEPPASTGDLREDCVNRVNQFRAQCLCLPPLERWTEGESCADEQAAYDAAQDRAHAGFSDDICSPSGWGQNECPGFDSEEQVIGWCLQAMWSEGPPPSEPCDGQCFQEHGHFINMTNPNHTKVACGFHTTAAGEVWAVQNYSD